MCMHVWFPVCLPTCQYIYFPSYLSTYLLTIISTCLLCINICMYLNIYIAYQESLKEQKHDSSSSKRYGLGEAEKSLLSFLLGRIQMFSDRSFQEEIATISALLYLLIATFLHTYLIFKSLQGGDR